MITTETILSIFLGIGLASASGFRVFLPLFALSLASYFGIWELNENWLWIGSIPALITLGIATVSEIFGYYIPFIDNLLDTIQKDLLAKKTIALNSLDEIVQSLCTDIETKLSI